MSYTRKTTTGALQAPTTCQSGSGEPQSAEELRAFHEQIRAEFRAEAAEMIRSERQAARQRRLDRQIGRAGIPPRFQNKRFDSFEAKHDWQTKARQTAEKYAENFDRALEAGTCMVMLGQPGSGKTHLACSIAQAVIETGHTAAFTSMGSLLRSIRDSYGSDQPERTVINQYTEPDLLIIDEIGVAIGREEVRHAQLLDIINARYENLRPTILLGNLTRDEMNRYLGDRIWRRITDDGAPVLAFGARK